MKILPDKKCVQCDKMFTPNRKWTIYCSTSCKMQHYYENKTCTIGKLEAEVLRLTELLNAVPKKKPVIKECDYCKDEFDINKPSTIKTSYLENGYNMKVLFCSKECKIKYMSEHPNYKLKI